MHAGCSPLGRGDGRYESAMAVQIVNVYELAPILLHLFFYLFFRGVGRREVEKYRNVEQFSKSTLNLYFLHIKLPRPLVSGFSKNGEAVCEMHVQLYLLQVCSLQGKLLP